MRILTGIAVAFIVIFIFGWILHGILLADHYAALPELFRPQEEMNGYFIWLFGGQLVVAIGLVLLLNLHGAELNTALGAKFGFCMGLLSAGSQAISYASIQNISLELLGWWMIGSFVQMTLLGALLGDILKGE